MRIYKNPLDKRGFYPISRQTDRISLPFSNALFQNYIEVFIRCMMPVSNRGYDAPFLRFWKGGIL